MIRRPPRSTLDRSSAASDVYKRQSMRRALGAESSSGAFVAPPRRRQFLDQVRSLAAGPGDGMREEAHGLAAAGVVVIDRHVQPGRRDLVLARVLGAADLQ